ncbi:hypothetical protein MMC25_005121 [Agyrium rufum]|nr:hypothetical protein [Agyrium rufum]
MLSLQQAIVKYLDLLKVRNFPEIFSELAQRVLPDDLQDNHDDPAAQFFLSNIKIDIQGPNFKRFMELIASKPIYYIVLVKSFMKLQAENELLATKLTAFKKAKIQRLSLMMNGIRATLPSEVFHNIEASATEEMEKIDRVSKSELKGPGIRETPKLHSPQSNSEATYTVKVATSSEISAVTPMNDAATLNSNKNPETTQVKKVKAKRPPLYYYDSDDEYDPEYADDGSYALEDYGYSDDDGGGLDEPWVESWIERQEEEY